MSEKRRVKLKKFTTIVVIAAVVNAIVGSGIVRHSVKWVAEGGSYAPLLRPWGFDCRFRFLAIFEKLVGCVRLPPDFRMKDLGTVRGF